MVFIFMISFKIKFFDDFFIEIVSRLFYEKDQFVKKMIKFFEIIGGMLLHNINNRKNI